MRHGGDNGPVSYPGDPDESRLIQAVRTGRAEDAPKGKLPPTRWIAESSTLGEDEARLAGRRTGRARPCHRAGRAAPRSTGPFAGPRMPPAGGQRRELASDARSIAFILAKLEAAGLPPPAEPPTGERCSAGSAIRPDRPAADAGGDRRVRRTTRRPDAYERLVDRLLASPHFGERWGRHWLDVARYAESADARRGFVAATSLALPRLRRSTPSTTTCPTTSSSASRSPATCCPAEPTSAGGQSIATGFLTLGNTQPRGAGQAAARMDVVDEQIDAIGRAFLGLTIGFARCHDHKFDPIPTRDYYALAGIFRSTQDADHDNVSKWKEVPYPLPPDEESRFAEHETRRGTTDAADPPDMKQKDRGRISRSPR